jgi:hypothetical protein
MDLFTLDLNGFQKLLSFDNIIRTTESGTTLHLRGRGVKFNSVIETLKVSPWYITIFGNGVNLNPYSLLEMQFPDMDFLRILWNFGIVGVIIWMGLVFWLIKSVRKSKKFIDKHLYRMCKITLIVFIVFGLTIENMIVPNFMYHIYLIIGFGYSQARRKNSIIVR